MMGCDGKSSYRSAMVDKESFYPTIETGFISDKEKDFIEQFSKTIFNQFNDQASNIVEVRYYEPIHQKTWFFNI